jgi:hypothetical protein
MVCFFENHAIFLPPSMVERNVLGSNSLRFLTATLGLMFGSPTQSSEWTRAQLPRMKDE